MATAARVREHTNLGWPQTPFGADKRPFPRNVRLVAATGVHWADDGDRAVPLAAGLVYLPVPRTGPLLIRPETLHVGYRVAVLDDPGDGPALVELIDGHLVQGRRHAAALAVYGWLDDAAALRSWASGDTPGITAVAAACSGAATAERGIAPVIETPACGQDGMPLALPAVCAQRGLSITSGAGGLLGIPEIQAAYGRALAAPGLWLSPDERSETAERLGLSALYQSLLMALLASEEAGRCTWERPFAVDQVLASVAWDAFPHALRALPAAAIGAG